MFNLRFLFLWTYWLLVDRLFRTIVTILVAVVIPLVTRVAAAALVQGLI